MIRADTGYRALKASISGSTTPDGTRRRFAFVTASYVVVCLVAAAIIILRGDGPHPRITALSPPNGDQFFPGGLVGITFSQPMDESSVERALQVSPGSQGQGVWYDNTLNIQPVGDWKPDVTYRVALVGAVTDDQGRPLQKSLSFRFRVHHIQHLAFCAVAGVRNVCERVKGYRLVIAQSSEPILQYALSDDGSMLAYTRRDASGLPHLFLMSVDGTWKIQLTRGRKYADSAPFWIQNDFSEVNYFRRPVTWKGTRLQLGRKQLWNVGTDGTLNLKL
jgi:hypothetical protein